MAEQSVIEKVKRLWFPASRRKGPDVALETADIALMADKLDNLPFAIGHEGSTVVVVLNALRLLRYEV